MEMVNIDQEIIDQIYKKASISLCSNISGQIGVGLMTNPPKPGDPSYELYLAESTGIFGLLSDSRSFTSIDSYLHTASLKRRAEKMVSVLNGLEGVTCNVARV